MPKNLCCCQPSGIFLALPCRYYKVGKIDVTNTDAVVFPQPPFGSGFPPNGPKRWDEDTGYIFDGGRQIIYMMRGGGGGSNLNGKGGNGAYGEYVAVASTTFKARSGRGGTGGQLTAVFSFPFAGGGRGYRTAGFGGGGSVIGNNLAANSAYGIVAAGGGAGTDFDGGHGGTKFGFTGEGLYGGGAPSQAVGGAAGLGPVPPGASPATPGTNIRGGHGLLNAGPIAGFGGGGAGGYFGGGGGGLSSGGGGASSLVKPEREAFFLPGTDNGPAALCNIHIANDPAWGLAGNRQSSSGLYNNTSNNGIQGIVSYYYIDKYCVCDFPSEPDLPDKVFLCLSQEQRDYILQELGPIPGDGWYPIFDLDGETYHLLGQGLIGCSEVCESPFRSSSTPTNIKWKKGPSFSDEEDGSLGGCCEVIRCFKVCDLTPCNTCECEDNNYYCCETEDKPDVYWSIRGTSLYRCEKTGANTYIDFGRTPEMEGFGIKECLLVTSETNIEYLCEEPKPNSCTINLESIDPDSIYTEFPTFTFSGAACDMSFDFIDCGSQFGLPVCYTDDPSLRAFSVTKTFNAIDSLGCFYYQPDFSSGEQIPEASLSLCITSAQNELPDGQREMVFEVEFFCDSETNNTAVDIRQTNANEYIVCGSKVICPSPGTFLTNIAAALNSLIASSTVVVRAGDGYHTQDLGSYEIETFPSGNLKKITWYSNFSPRYVTGYATGGVNFPVKLLDIFIRNPTATFYLNTISLEDYLTAGASLLQVISVQGDVSCSGIRERQCEDSGDLNRCACEGGVDCSPGGGQQPMGSGNGCEETCRADSSGWTVTFS